MQKMDDDVHAELARVVQEIHIDAVHEQLAALESGLNEHAHEVSGCGIACVRACTCCVFEFEDEACTANRHWLSVCC